VQLRRIANARATIRARMAAVRLATAAIATVKCWKLLAKLHCCPKRQAGDFLLREHSYEQAQQRLEYGLDRFCR
jgi:hypothetical protein